MKPMIMDTLKERWTDHKPMILQLSAVKKPIDRVFEAVKLLRSAAGINIVNDAVFVTEAIYLTIRFQVGNKRSWIHVVNLMHVGWVIVETEYEWFGYPIYRTTVPPFIGNGLGRIISQTVFDTVQLALMELKRLLYKSVILHIEYKRDIHYSLAHNNFKNTLYHCNSKDSCYKEQLKQVNQIKNHEKYMTDRLVGVSKKMKNQVRTAQLKAMVKLPQNIQRTILNKMK